MPNAGKLGDSYPSFNAFGASPRLLDDVEAVTATPDERIASVWRYCARRSATFYRALKPREKRNYDIEDVLLEVYVMLREKDAKWQPERGKYITYVGTLMDNFLCSVRDRARTVHSPRNSSCRMREYQAEEDAGTITDRRARTFHAIRRTAGSLPEVMEDSAVTAVEPGDIAEDREHTRNDVEAITLGLIDLTPFEALCLGKTSGLWGNKRMTIAEVADLTGRARNAVKEARERAATKIRRRLYDMGHPAVASDN